MVQVRCSASIRAQVRQHTVRMLEKLTPQKAYISSPEIATSPVIVNQTSVQALAKEVAGLKLEEERPGATDRMQEEEAR